MTRLERYLTAISLLIVALASFTLIFWGWFPGAWLLAAGFLASALVFRSVRLQRIGRTTLTHGQDGDRVRPSTGK